jgi:hypothetical protein
MQQPQHIVLPIQNGELQIGLSWDFSGGEKVDLDATLLMINDMG